MQIFTKNKSNCNKHKRKQKNASEINYEQRKNQINYKF